MSVIEKARALVHGPRQDSYGHPFDDFTRTGRMWGGILSEWAKDPSKPVPPNLVALCQIAVKVSREVHAHKEDNLVDIAGYDEALDLVVARQTVTEQATVTPLPTATASNSPSTSFASSASGKWTCEDCGGTEPPGWAAHVCRGGCE